MAGVSRVKLSGLVGIVQGGAGRSSGVDRLSSLARCVEAISSISVGSCVSIPVSGFLILVSLGLVLAEGLSPAETFSPLWLCLGLLSYLWFSMSRCFVSSLSLAARIIWPMALLQFCET